MTMPTSNSCWTFAGRTVQVLHVSEPYHKFGRMWPSEVLYIFSGNGQLEPRTRILSLPTFLSLYDRQKENLCPDAGDLGEETPEGPGSLQEAREGVQTSQEGQH